jgi:hypothetical protein
VKIYEVGKGEPPQTREQTKARIYESKSKIDASYLPYLEGKDINSYTVNWSDKWLKYGKNLAAPRNINLFTGERILVRRIMGERLICAYLNEDIISNALLQIIKPFDSKLTKSILLILSSSVIAYFFRKSSDRQDIIFPEIKIHELSSLPIKLPSNCEKFTAVADSILELHSLLQKNINKFLNRVTDNFELTKKSKKLESFYQHEFKVFIAELKKKNVNLTLLQQDEWEEYFTSYKDKINEFQIEISATRAKVDKMVYQLYELSEKEIKIIERIEQ